MLTALRYYWITAKGYRLRPWRSPYIRWRLETFLGSEATEKATARGFAHFLWHERPRLRTFIRWVGQRRAAMRRSG